MGRLKLFFCTALIAVASCSQPVAPPTVSQGAVGAVPEYFWRTPPSALALVGDSLHPGLHDNLTFVNNAGLLQVNDGNIKPIYCVVNSDSVYASNISTGSVIDLDYGSYFSALDTEMLLPHKMRTVAILGSSTIEIGTDTGVFEKITSNSNYKFSGLGGRDIKLLATYSDNSTVYAVTTGDSVFFSTKGGGWQMLDLLNLPTGHITAFYSDSDQYAVVEGSSGVFVHPGDGSGWTIVPFLQDRRITAISSFHNGQNGVLLGTSEGYAGACNAAGTSLSLLQQMHGSGAIHSFQTTSSATYAGTDSGLFQNTAPGLTPSWQLIKTTAGYRPITKVGYRAAGGVFFLANGVVVTWDQPSGPVTAGLSASAIDLTCGTMAVAITITTAYGRDQTGIRWSVIQDSVRYYYPYIPGGLVMLRKDQFAVGNNWRAGTLVNYDHSSYAFTGRVMQRLDALQINGKQYPDVFVIRYAHELSGSVADANHVPYWVIYYERGVGPIMFDKVGLSGQFIRREIQTP